MVELTHGGFQANARMRDESGQLRRLKVVGGTCEDARRALVEQAATIRYGTDNATLTGNSTVAQACAVFLDDKRHSGTVEASTVETELPS